MYYFRITLRFVLGTVTSLYIITALFHVFENGIEYSAEYILMWSILFFQIPATLILITASIYSYLTKGVLWSLFRIEYYFLLASMSPFLIGWFLYVIWPYFI